MKVTEAQKAALSAFLGRFSMRIMTQLPGSIVGFKLMADPKAPEGEEPEPVVYCSCEYMSLVMREPTTWTGGVALEDLVEGVKGGKLDQQVDISAAEALVELKGTAQNIRQRDEVVQ